MSGGVSGGVVFDCLSGLLALCFPPRCVYNALRRLPYVVVLLASGGSLPVLVGVLALLSLALLLATRFFHVEKTGAFFGAVFSTKRCLSWCMRCFVLLTMRNYGLRRGPLLASPPNVFVGACPLPQAAIFSSFKLTHAPSPQRM